LGVVFLFFARGVIKILKIIIDGSHVVVFQAKTIGGNFPAHFPYSTSSFIILLAG
jgi:hypothetical protein